MRWLTLAVVAALPALTAADWPQWRGPGRDNVSTETGLLKTWPAGGPKLLWSYKDAGVGYSGPAVVGNVLYTAGGRGDSEFVYALDLSGAAPKELWAVKLGPLFQWKGNSWNAGPITTPAVADGMVYVVSGSGEVVCVEAKTGKEVWRKSSLKDLKGEVDPVGGGLGTEDADPKLGWGYACSPLVDGDTVLVVPGGPDGTFAALDAKTGAVKWRSKDLKAQATYSSPVAATIGGVKQYIQMTNDGAAGVNARDGALLWQYKREDAYQDIVAPTPVIDGDLVFITAGPSGGRDLIRVKNGGGKFSTEAVYADKKIENHHGGVLRVGDLLYGCSGETRASWFCQEFKSGKILWSESDRKLGKGSCLFADGCLYCYGEKDGLAMLVEASPKGWQPKGSFSPPAESKLRGQLKLARGGFWTHPVVADGKLYLRDQELIFCYDVKAK